MPILGVNRFSANVYFLGHFHELLTSGIQGQDPSLDTKI